MPPAVAAVTRKVWPWPALTARWPVVAPRSRVDCTLPPGETSSAVAWPVWLPSTTTYLPVGGSTARPLRTAPGDTLACSTTGALTAPRGPIVKASVRTGVVVLLVGSFGFELLTTWHTR